MMYAAVCLLTVVSAMPPRSKLMAHNEEYSSDSPDEPTICYGDDECRGRQMCDMGSYICVDPTPSPETPAPTDAPGCCYGDSYKANDKCVMASSQDKCESKGCNWLVTD